MTRCQPNYQRPIPAEATYCDIRAESLNSLKRKVVHYKETTGKHVSTATKTRHRGNGYARNGRRTWKRCFLLVPCGVYITGHLWVEKALPMDCYLDAVGGLVPLLRCEEGRPKTVRDKVAGKGQQKNY
jgi:hypothetical protein